MRLVAPETITFTQSGFCPGCGHGLAVRLIAEVMEEMGLSEKLLAIVDVACGSLNIDSWIPLWQHMDVPSQRLSV